MGPSHLSIQRQTVWIKMEDEDNRIYHHSLMQTEKSQPEGKQIMLETRFTEFPVLFFDLGMVGWCDGAG